MSRISLPWTLASAGTCTLLVLPILAIGYTALSGGDEVFAHLFATVMPTYISNTVLLTVGVMILAAVFGVPSAWLIAKCQFPTDKLLQWLLVLPLAMPSYIVAYVFTDWLDFAGPVQSALRSWFGWQAREYWFPDIRSLYGACWILALVLYPYVYLLTRAAFLQQSSALTHSARLLNCNAWQTFFRVSLPLARPAIAISLTLVAMETVGDFGTVSYFSLNTLTTAVYDTWLGYASLSAAAKISLLMLIVVIFFISAERYSRRRQRLFQPHIEISCGQKVRLSGWAKWSALLWCWGLVILAFLLPLMQLAIYAYHYFLQSWTEEFRQYAINSLTVSVVAAILAVFVALIVNFCHRLQPSVASQVWMRGAATGYAVPGTVLAIGVMIPVLFVDHALNDVAKWMEWQRPGLLLSGSLFALVFAMVVRFSAVAIGSVESNLKQIPPSLDMASKTLGCNSNQMLWHIHWPLIRRGALIAFLLVFIESMKELNAALLLRPFNFETLATYVFNYASDEQLELAAMPAMLLVLVGLIPLVLINRSLEGGVK